MGIPIMLSDSWTACYIGLKSLADLLGGAQSSKWRHKLCTREHQTRPTAPSTLLKMGEGVFLWPEAPPLAWGPWGPCVRQDQVWGSQGRTSRGAPHLSMLLRGCWERQLMISFEFCGLMPSSQPPRVEQLWGVVIYHRILNTFPIGLLTRNALLGEKMLISEH